MREQLCIGYCFQVYRGEMCPHFFNIFLFLQRFDTQGHHMVCRESSKIEGLVKLLGEVG